MYGIGGAGHGEKAFKVAPDPGGEVGIIAFHIQFIALEGAGHAEV